MWPVIPGPPCIRSPWPHCYRPCLEVLTVVIALVGRCRPSGQTSLQWMGGDFRRVRRIPTPGKRAKNKAAQAVMAMSGKGEPKVVQRHRHQNKCPRFVVTLLHVRYFLYHPASPDSQFLSLPTRLYCKLLKRPSAFPSAAETWDSVSLVRDHLSFSFVLVRLCYPPRSCPVAAGKDADYDDRRDNAEA